MTGTLTLAAERPSEERPLVRGPQLVLAMDCANPTRRPARFSLEGIDTVRFGRGPRREREREERTLHIRVDDGFLSSAHLQFERDGSDWFVVDLGSKNGSRLQGEPLVGRQALCDRAILAAGQTLVLFLRQGASLADAPVEDLAGVPESAAHLTTLHAELALAFADLRGIANSALPVLIHGETGSGKEAIAHSVHAHSGRKGPLIAVNCGALPPTLITSELFGARKGAFSGATENRQGLIRAADGGTLFLDEIAELPLDAQTVLLRVLQEGQVLPVGEDRPVEVNVRVVAASHQDLLVAVQEGRFREDLYARLAGYAFTLPPLRQRPADIGLIAGVLLERDGHHGIALSTEAGRALLAHAWPRNVREMRHALAAAAAVAKKQRIELEHLPPSLRTHAPENSEAALRDALERHQGNVSAVARDLGTSRSQVRRLAERFAIDLTSFRP